MSVHQTISLCWKAGLLWLMMSIGTLQTDAQTYTFTDTSSTALNETVASCTGTPISVNYAVTQTDTVGDVRLSVLATHTYRGDIEVTLESPAGTRVLLATQNGGRGGDNLNVTFDDAATDTYAASSNTATHATGAPPYEFSFSPDNALSAFDNEAMNGTWTMEICDAFNADSGTYIRSDLELDAAVPNADLSLMVSETVSNPATGTNTTLTFTLNNAGPDAASGITVSAPLPAGLSYVSDTGSGAYNNTTGIWTVPGSVSASGSASIDIVAQANASGSGAIIAEVTASSLPDPDSTPDNRDTDPTEDDTAATTLIINGPPPGTPPTLTCPVATTTFDWDTEAWTTGSLSQNFTSGVGIDFTITGDTGTFVNNAGLGGQSPVETTVLTGGLSPAEQSLLLLVNYTSSSQQIIVTIDVGTAGEGVDGIQFDIFDVDINPDTSQDANFIDRLQIFGSLSGSTVGPILTQGTVNTVSGSTATGTAAGASASAEGNITVTFDAPVDQIVIYYDNDPATASNPGQQGISLHDMTYCQRGRDFSDAPGYGTPSHLIRTGYRIGFVEGDRDTGSNPTAGADGDDTTDTDDEEGVSIPTLTQGDTTTLNIPVNGPGGFFQAWIDWDGDSTFEASEQIATDAQAVGGTVSVPISVPLSATTSQTYARLRWSTQSGLGADGDAPDGEVEDYALTINAGSTISCPAGRTLVTQAGNASSVIQTAFNSTQALGVPETVGTTATNSNSARLTSTQPTLILDLEDLVAEGATLDVTLARNNGGANYDIDLSADNITYSPITTFNTGTQDSLQVISLIVPSGGAQFIRFQRNGGSLWVGGIAYSDVCLSGAELQAAKSTVVYDPTASDLFAIPGNDVIYTITVTNSGDGAADTDSIELIDAMPDLIEFFSDTTPEFGGNTIGWTDNSSGLTFNEANDVRYSDAATPPANFAACGYSPATGYDPNVTYICFNPKGAMAAGDPDPSFAVSFRARIR